jgi:hypothetical protein
VSFFVSNFLCGQETDEKSSKVDDIQWNKHKFEVGLDFQFFDRNLRLNSIGSNLIFKKHIGEKKFISKNEKKALRLQIGGFVDYPIGKQDSLGNFAGLNNIRLNEEKFVNVRLLVGIEWQKQINRIQLFYGVDGGIGYFERVEPLSITSSTQTGEIIGYSTVERSNVSVPLHVFMGVKYFIHPRISLSIESALDIGLGWSTYKRTSYDNQFVETSTTPEAKRRDVFFDTDYLRYLNISFHF